MTTAFVTGGSGFVGGQLIRDLRAEGSVVCALVRSDSAARKVEALGAVPVHGAIDDVTVLTHAMAGSQIVLHAAAHMEMGGPYRVFDRVNVKGTRALLDAARAAKVRRFVQIGAAPVIKNAGPVAMADETWPLQKVRYAPYLKTKAIADDIVRAASGPDLEAMVVRPPLIWGPEGRLIPMLLDRVAKGQWRWLAGMRFPYSVVHVRNVSKAALLVAEKGQGGEAYNITDGVSVELRTFLTDLLAAHGADPGQREMPYLPAITVATLVDAVWNTFGLTTHPPISRLMVRLMGQTFTVSDAKIRNQLGFSNAVSLDDGLSDLAATNKAT